MASTLEDWDVLFNTTSILPRAMQNVLCFRQLKCMAYENRSAAIVPQANEHMLPPPWLCPRCTFGYWGDPT